MNLLSSLRAFVVWLAAAVLAGTAGAATVWNASGGPADWQVASNWTAGVPVAAVPGETKAVFNKSGRAECVVRDARAFGQLVQGDNGVGGLIRIQAGGSLSSGANWTAVGYNRDARMVVEAGGSLNCGDHLWVGLIAPAVGTLDIDGGTVNVAGQCGLGWSGGTGLISIKHGGVLNLTQLDASQSIGGASAIDLETGSMVINGDRGAIVHDYIAAGKITGYGGTGTAVYDYNVSNAGKTTVRAVVGRINANWRVVATQYPTSEPVVTPFDAATDFGIVADGVTDVTGRIQSALVMLGNLGGGALFLPAGHYRVDGNLTIPSGVTLRGDWRKPGPGQPVVGTVLMARAGRDDENAVPFITLSNSAGVNGLSIWYPEQSPADIRPYPPTIGNGGGATVENVTFVNSYWAYTSFVAGTTARPFLRNLCGTPLKTGIEYDCLADIGRIESVHFSPACWQDSKLPGAPAAGEHAAWIRDHGTGIILRRIDWSYSCHVTIEGYSIGLALRPGRVDGRHPNGQSYGFNLLDCRTGVEIEASDYAGYQFTRFDIRGAETGIRLAPTAGESDMFHSCTVEATGDAVRCEGATARVLMMSCDIRQGAVRMSRGYLSVINSDFAARQPVHVELAAEVAGATILGNRFAGGARILDRTRYPVHIDHAPVAVEPLPAYDFRKPATAGQPGQPDLFVVTAAPYHARADGVTDDTAAFAAALAAAGANGGGTVFVPGGSYRLNGTLTVPAGVELRGIFDTPHDTKVKGSLLNVYSGRDDPSGTPFLRLEGGAGVRGLTFHYPEQIYNAADTVNHGMVPYPFLIRGLGSDVRAVNLSATIPYQLLDLATHRCDRHYIDYIFATALKTGLHVGNGAVDGQIHNCQLNPSAYTHAGGYYDSIPSNTAADIHKILWRDATPYLFGHMTGEVLHENFVFGGARGFHLVREGGLGPSGHCLGMGVDQCTNAMQIDAVGSAGLAPINSQIVTVDGAKGHYLETGAGLQDSFRMFSAAGWGTHEFSAVIHGGEVRLQLFHLARDGESGAFKVLNQASLTSLGGNLDDFLAAGHPFLTIDPGASAGFVGNILNTTEAQMPADSGTVTALGNLRFGAPASGSDKAWSNGSGSRAWNNPANWDGGLPGSNDEAVVGPGTTLGPLVAAGTSAAARTLVVGGPAGTANTLEINGGSLDVANWLVLGHAAGDVASFALSAGDATIGGDLFVGLHGAGALQLSGGSLSVGGMLAVAANPGTTGTVSLAAGTLRAGTLHLAAGATLDLTAGTLIVDGDATATLNLYIAGGLITAYGGIGVLALDYDASNPGKTTLTASQPPLMQTVWNPAVSDRWTDAANWTGGAAPMIQSQHLKVVFNIHSAAACHLDTAATVGQLVVGDNGTPDGNFLVLADGADLTCGLDAFGRIQWTAVGYNRNATATVRAGAKLGTAGHLWVGLFAPSVGTLNIDGGQVRVAGQFGLGWSGGTGRLDIRNGGTLDLTSMHATQSIGGASVLDLRTGSVAVAGDKSAILLDYAAAGKITAFDGNGAVHVRHEAGTNRTTVSATPPASGYDAWAIGWGSDVGRMSEDFDGDLRTNLHEYAFAGDPTDRRDRGAVPRFAVEDGVIKLRHLVRKDDPRLSYAVQSSPDLSPGSWNEAGFQVLGITGFNPAYDEISYALPAGSKALFVRVVASFP